MNVEWKPIPGYEGYYEISNEGVVRSKLRTITKSNGRCHTIPEHIMKVFEVNDTNPTARVELNKNGRRKDMYLPNLVASIFLGLPYDSIVYHKDGNLNNNNASNLTSDITQTQEYRTVQDGEVWRPVVGYEDRYEVSNLGRLRTLGNRINHSRSGYNQRHTRLHSFSTAKQWGYICVGLWKDGKCKQRMLHRLVAEAFLPNPKNLPFVNHIDGNKRNNTCSNLEWCTAKENAQHAIRTGLNLADGKNKPVKCLTNNTIYKSISEAERALHVDRQSILESIVREQPYSGYQFILL